MTAHLLLLQKRDDLCQVSPARIVEVGQPVLNVRRRVSGNALPPGRNGFEFENRRGRNDDNSKQHHDEPQSRPTSTSGNCVRTHEYREHDAKRVDVVEKRLKNFLCLYFQKSV